MSQQLVVIGEPIPCDRRGCGEPAVVYLRELDGDGEAQGVTYCETCWLGVRIAHAPLVGRDTPAAVREAVALTAGQGEDEGDGDGQSSRVLP